MEMMEDIIAEMRELYLRNSEPWLLMFSRGKDSTLQLVLTWKMLERLQVEERHKTVHVIIGETMVETPSMTEFVEQGVHLIRRAAAEQQLPIEVHLARPEMRNRYFYKVLGMGVTPINKKTSFRWCSDKLKLQNTSVVVNRIVGRHFSFGSEYSALMLLGVRLDESSSRKASINRHAIDDTKFARHVHQPMILCYHPIKYITTEELWSYLLSIKFLPWGERSTQLYLLYKKFAGGECPMTSAGEQVAACGGNSRNGCWTCTAMDRDKMLESQIEDDPNIQYLLDYKMILLQIRNDIRYRSPLRKKEYRATGKRLDSFNGQLNAYDLEGDPYANFQRMKDWRFEPGPITFEARKHLLEKLLYIQQTTGYHLIDDDEVGAIIHCWQIEGYQVSMEEIQPVDWEYDGALVLHPDGRKNNKETTTPYPIFVVWREMEDGSDEVIQYLRARERKTGKSIFYFMDSVDLHEDYGQRERFAYNLVQFIVCDASVKSQKAAEEFVEQWIVEQPKYEPLPEWVKMKYERELTPA